MESRIITTQSRLYPDAQRLLESYELNTSDIDNSQVTLWATEDSGKLVGVVGMEKAQGIGLLRSLAVAQNYQRGGIAKRLCEKVFRHAKQQNISELYLLTETAAHFFERIGFTELSRENVPASLQATSQFSELCPASATVMVKFDTTSP